MSDIPAHIPHSVVKHVMCNLLNLTDEQWSGVRRIELTPHRIIVTETRYDDNDHARVADDDIISRVTQISYRGES